MGNMRTRFWQKIAPKLIKVFLRRDANPFEAGPPESYWRAFMEIYSKNTAILNKKYSII